MDIQKDTESEPREPIDNELAEVLNEYPLRSSKIYDYLRAIRYRKITKVELNPLLLSYIQQQSVQIRHLQNVSEQIMGGIGACVLSIGVLDVFIGAKYSKFRKFLAFPVFVIGPLIIGNLWQKRRTYQYITNMMKIEKLQMTEASDF